MQQAELDTTTQLGAPYPVLIRGHSLRKTRTAPSATSQLNESFDAITVDGTIIRGGDNRGVGASEHINTAPGGPVENIHSRAHQNPPLPLSPPIRQNWGGLSPDRTSSLLDEDFDLLTSSAGLSTERGSILYYNHTGVSLPPDRSQKRTTPDRGRVGEYITGSAAAPVPLSPSTKRHHRRISSGGPRFEVVKSQVVEDGPERTVTVSVWREQVTKPIGPNGETMNVHYYSADEVFPDGVLPGTMPISEAGGNTPRRGTPLPPQERAVSELSYHHISPPPPSGPSGSRSEVGYYQSEPILHNDPPPRTSTPPRARHHPPTPTYTSTFTSSQDMFSSFRPSMASIPHLSPHHESGADNSISTVKSLPTIELEKILDSCEPSLIHVAPILASLGITQEGHLKAVGRLSEETRDREVKEEALKLGMMVMEWAILLDRLHSL